MIADTVIIGGAVIGSACAHFLVEDPDHDAAVVVVEADPTYARSSTALSAASVRHQFSKSVNVELSQFGTTFISEFRERVQVDGEAPDLGYRETGYLFLATAAGMDVLRRNNATQRACGADISLLTPDDMRRRFPYLCVDDLAGGSYGERGEGTLDAYSLMQGFRQRARHRGATYLHDRVVGLDIEADLVRSVRLASGRRISCRHVVNCAGPAAATIASMAGLELPVEPRRRSVFVFDSRVAPIPDADLTRFPLHIDPSGVWVRADPPYFLTGTTPIDDGPVDHADFAVRTAEFEELIWPVLAERIPAFDALGVKRSWAGHYAYNTLDQNAIVGPAEPVSNLFLANGFSGHGLQQAAGVGRAISELIVHGRYLTIDLTELGYRRVIDRAPFVEEAII